MSALFAVTADSVVSTTTPAAQLTDSPSLSHAETIIREATGISELRYDTDKAARLRTQRTHVPTTDDLPDVDRHAHRAYQHGAVPGSRPTEHRGPLWE